MTGSSTAVEISSALAIAQMGAVCVVVWRDEVTQARFERQRAALARAIASYPGEAAFLCVVESHVKPPSDDLRRASSEMIRAHEGRLRCMAAVIEADGFMGALTRSVLLGMAAVRRQRVPLAYFATVTEAVGWMQRQLPLEPAPLIAAVATLRASSHKPSLPSGAESF